MVYCIFCLNANKGFAGICTEDGNRGDWLKTTVLSLIPQHGSDAGIAAVPVNTEGFPSFCKH